MSDRSNYKKLASFLESTDNPEAKHKMITKGPEKGQTAIGQYGLLPDTIQTIARGLKRDKLANETDKILSKANKEQITDMFKNDPALVDHYMNILADRNNKAVSNDPTDAYIKHHSGLNLKRPGIERVKDKNPDDIMERIPDAIDLKHLMSENPSPVEPPDMYVDRPYSSVAKKNKQDDTITTAAKAEEPNYFEKLRDKLAQDKDKPIDAQEMLTSMPIGGLGSAGLIGGLLDKGIMATRGTALENVAAPAVEGAWARTNSVLSNRAATLNELNKAKALKEEMDMGKASIEAAAKNAPPINNLTPEQMARSTEDTVTSFPLLTDILKKKGGQ